MPFALNYEDKDPNQKDQNAQNISGVAGTFDTGIPGSEQGQKDPKSSGYYANIQSYIDANHDQADSMGQKIAGDVTQKADDATSKIQALDQKAPQVQAYDPNAAYSNLGNLTAQQKQDYQNYKTTGGYSGPDSIDKVDGYSDTMKAATDANDLVKSTGSELGQQQLLKNTYARPNYSAGENKLDQALLGGSQASRQALEGVGSKYAGLDQLFTDTSNKVGNAINASNAQALANKQNIANSEASQWTNLVNPIQARADQMNIDNPAMIKRIQDDVSDDTLSPETMALLGLTDGQNLYSANLSNYISPNYTKVGLNDAANQDERNKYQALADLVGDPSRNQLSATASGADLKPVNFNSDLFQKDLAQMKQEQADLFANTIISGHGEWGSGGDDHSSSDATESVADYLKGLKNLQFQTSVGDGRPHPEYDFTGEMPGYARLSIKAEELAVAQAYKNLQDYLNQSNYYRTVKKG